MEVDCLIIGGGIAGTSLAAHLAPHKKVLILEAEAHAGYHSTGRSAALFSEIYGGDAVRALSRASRAFFEEPGDEFSPTPLTSPRGALFLSTPLSRDALDSFAVMPDVARATRRLSSTEACVLCPALRQEMIAGAVFEPDSSDIDVHALHQAYIRQARRHGATLLTGHRATAISRANGRWTITANDRTFVAVTVVNAAGAWADQIASMAGVAPIGLVPKRRTVCAVDAPPDASFASWPMVVGADESFYFKPDGRSLLLSPADETPTEPSDVQAEEWDIAVAIDRVQAVTTLDIRHVKRRWAGLRSFVADGAPVAGFAEGSENFFWLAGQGGYGIQTAPALAEFSASIILERDLPPHIAACGLTVRSLSPRRLEEAPPQVSPVP